MALTANSLLRLYAPHEAGSDGYPPQWHVVDLGPQGFYASPGERWGPGIKHLARADAGHRCIRCGHPYRVGQEAFYATDAPEGTAIEAAALTLFDHEPTDETRAKRMRPVHWSPCDEHCRHGGLIRSKRASEPESWTIEDLGPREWDDDSAKDAIEAGYEQQAAWRILTVHHADGDKLNCRWWNLLALCQRCHLSVQGRVQMDRVYPWEHSPWFKPYVAGFYAWRYLGEELTRVQVEARLDELLNLERAAPSSVA